MRRRDLIAGLGASVAAFPLGARAEMPSKHYRIAIAGGLLPAAGWRSQPLWRAFLDELRRRGEAEGRTLTIEAYSGNGRSAHYTDFAYEVADHKPDVIVCDGSPLATAFKLTTSLPIIAAMQVPLNRGLVPSLAHPGGHVTGVSVDPGLPIWLKRLQVRLQVLKELVPSARRVAYLSTRQVADGFLRHVQFGAGERLGLTLGGMSLDEVTPAAVERAFAQLSLPRPDAILVTAELELAVLGGQIAALANRYRLPAMYPYAEYARAGGLMAYAPDLAEVGRQLADDVRQVLDGAEPGDIPVYQPTRFKLTINLKAARAIGLSFPQLLLAQADEVIE